MGKRRSQEEWSQLLEAYAKRDCTQEAFCRRHGLSSGTLKYQLDRQQSQSKFVPAVREVKSSAEVSLELPSGICITVRS